jgi:hypothetical protein
VLVDSSCAAASSPSISATRRLFLATPIT